MNFQNSAMPPLHRAARDNPIVKKLYPGGKVYPIFLCIKET